MQDVCFEVLAILGSGTHGDVFHCRELIKGKKFVLKRILRKAANRCDSKDESVKDFYNRVDCEYHMNRFAWQLAEKYHKTRYFVEPKSLWFEEMNDLEGGDNTAFITFPSHGGMNLKDFLRVFMRSLKSTERFNKIAYRIIAQVLRAVDFLNTHNVYHCDLKLPNVLIYKENHQQITLADVLDDHVQFNIKLIDFGLATVNPDDALAIYYSRKNQLGPWLIYSLGSSGQILNEYRTTEYARDPRSRVHDLCKEEMRYFSRYISHTKSGVPLFSPFQMQVFFPWFEIYAVAVIVQLIFDLNCNPEMLVFRKTNRMSEELYALICEMTGPLNDRQSALQYAKRFASLE